MWSALEAVKAGESPVVISCGNTGALMALVDARAAQGARASTGRRSPCSGRRSNPSGYNVLLDAGADIRADADDLLKYAVMGASYARNALGLTRPRVGLLNVGTEEHKGRSELHEAAERIAAIAPASDFEYIGYVEGSDMPSDRVDVIVTDGFTGNVALKTGEGTARMIRACCARPSPTARSAAIGALFALTSLKRLQKRIDPRRVNGGVFLGLNGTVIKSHGSADATGVSAAIKLAFTLADHGFTQQLAARVGGSGRAAPTPRAGACRHERAARRAARLRPLPAGARRRERRVRRARSTPPTSGSAPAPASSGGTSPPTARLTSDLAIAAARAALADAGLTGADIDALILATATPDQTFPSTAVKVQSAIGMRGGFAFDIQAVCAGFVFALAQADALIRAGAARRVMVIGAETFSRILDFTDRATCVLFGDGAGALILEAAEGERHLRRPRHPRHRPALRRPLRRPALRRRRPVLDRHRRRRADGRPGGLQARRGQARRDRRRGAGARRAHHRRRRLAGAAPGEPADHDDDRAQARRADGARRGHRAGPRQHLGRLDSAGAVGRARRRAASCRATCC